MTKTKPIGIIMAVFSYLGFMFMSESPERGCKEHAVLQAARTVFLAHGFSAATTDMIQRAAGVSKATMYACFPNKEALFVAVIEQACAGMAAVMQSVEATPGDIGKTLTAIGTAYINMILEPDGMALFRVVAAESPRFPELGRRFYLTGPSVGLALTAKQLGKAAQNGEIDLHSVGADAAASLFLSMVRGHAQLEGLTHPDTCPSAVQKDYWVQIAVTTFLAAFAVRS